MAVGVPAVHASVARVDLPPDQCTVRVSKRRLRAVVGAHWAQHCAVPRCERFWPRRAIPTRRSVRTVRTARWPVGPVVAHPPSLSRRARVLRLLGCDGHAPLHRGEDVGLAVALHHVFGDLHRDAVSTLQGDVPRHVQEVKPVLDVGGGRGRRLCRRRRRRWPLWRTWRRRFWAWVSVCAAPTGEAAVVVRHLRKVVLLGGKIALAEVEAVGSGEAGAVASHGCAWRVVAVEPRGVRRRMGASWTRFYQKRGRSPAKKGEKSHPRTHDDATTLPHDAPAQPFFLSRRTQGHYSRQLSPESTWSPCLATRCLEGRTPRLRRSRTSGHPPRSGRLPNRPPSSGCPFRGP